MKDLHKEAIECLDELHYANRQILECQNMIFLHKSGVSKNNLDTLHRDLKKYYRQSELSRMRYCKIVAEINSYTEMAYAKKANSIYINSYCLN